MSTEDGHCPICVEASKQPKPECKHRTPLVDGYGFGRVSGWWGIGITYRCPDCSETLWFEEDWECTDGERNHNKPLKEKNKAWGEAVARGEVIRE